MSQFQKAHALIIRVIAFLLYPPYNRERFISYCAVHTCIACEIGSMRFHSANNGRSVAPGQS